MTGMNTVKNVEANAERNVEDIGTIVVEMNTEMTVDWSTGMCSGRDAGETWKDPLDFGSRAAADWASVADIGGGRDVAARWKGGESRDENPLSHLSLLRPLPAPSSRSVRLRTPTAATGPR